MTYDIRLFCRPASAVSVLDLQSAMEECRIEVIEADTAAWTQLLVTTPRGDEICIIERASGKQMLSEIAVLRRDLQACRPQSAAHWAGEYLTAARDLYGCRYLSFGLSKPYVAIAPAVMWAIQTLAGGGIVHAEGQGFSNEDGYQITWEFSGKVAGTRQVAVLGPGARWHAFELGLDDDDQLSAFLLGKRPLDAELLEFN